MNEAPSLFLTVVLTALFTGWGIIKLIAFSYLFQCAIRDWRRSYKSRRRRNRR